MSIRRPVPACKPPNCAVRYQSVLQAVAVLASIVMDAVWGSSPEPAPVGPNAETLTGVRTLAARAGARDFVGAGVGAAAWACRCVAAPTAVAWLVRDELVPRLEWNTAISATASAAHTSIRTIGQRARRACPLSPGSAGSVGGGASTAMVLSASATVVCPPGRRAWTNPRPPVLTLLPPGAGSDSCQPSVSHWPSVSTS